MDTESQFLLNHLSPLASKYLNTDKSISQVWCDKAMLDQMLNGFRSSIAGNHTANHQHPYRHYPGTEDTLQPHGDGRRHTPGPTNCTTLWSANGSGKLVRKSSQGTLLARVGLSSRTCLPRSPSSPPAAGESSPQSVNC